MPNKLTIVVNSLGMGGAEKSVAGLANYLTTKDFVIEILTFTSDKFYNLDPRIRHIDLNVGTKDMLGLRKLYTLLKIPWILRRHFIKSGANVISFMDQANIFSLIASFATNIKVIVCERTNPKFSSITDRRRTAIARIFLTTLRYWIYRRAKRVVVQTESAKRAFAHLAQENVVVIPNCLQALEQRTADMILPQPNILSLGRYHTDKRPDILIQAFAKITKKHPGWKLVFVGSGPEIDALVTLSSSLGIFERVVFMGPTKTASAVLEQTQIFALSSKAEGFPNALLEAMQVGRAVISTNCNYGPSELIENGVNGFLVPINEIATFAHFLDTLMADEQLRLRFGIAAKETSKRYSAEQVNPLWENLLK